MSIEYFLDNLKFISQGGAVSITVAAMLLAMSIGSWTLMVVKTVQARRLKSSNARFLGYFRQVSSESVSVPISVVANVMNGHLQKAENPFARLTLQGINAAVHHNRYLAQRRIDNDEFIAQALRRAIGQEVMRLESGLTLLATVGSIAPFVGLFGTVWGIYHALGSIAVGGLATIDKVAGPVGEALIMTAFGLAVAIPAVLAYNVLVRDNRLFMGDMETFAHDLHIYLTTGVPFVAVQMTELTVDTNDCAYPGVVAGASL